jgi:hypothetical protein
MRRPWAAGRSMPRPHEAAGQVLERARAPSRAAERRRPCAPSAARPQASAGVRLRSIPGQEQGGAGPGGPPVCKRHTALCSRPAGPARRPTQARWPAGREPTRPRLAALGRVVRADEADQARVVHLAQRLHVVHHLVALVLRRARDTCLSHRRARRRRPHDRGAGRKGAEQQRTSGRRPAAPSRSS